MKWLRNGALLLVFGEYTSKLLVYSIAFLQMRKMTPIVFGQLSVALALVQSLVIAADGGMGQIVAQKIAERGGSYRERLERLFSLRLIFMAIAVLMAFMLSRFMNLSVPSLWIVALALAISCFSFVDFFSWCLKGLRDPHFSVLVQVGGRTTLFLLGASALFWDGTIRAFISAYLIGGIISSVSAWLIFGRRFHYLLLHRPSLGIIKDFFSDVGPFWGFFIGGVLMARADILLVSRFCGHAQAGLYAAASSITEGLSLIPLALFGYLMPIFSSLRKDPEKQKRIFLKMIQPFFVSSCIIAALASFCIKPLLLYFLGAPYRSSIPIAQLLVWTFVPISLSYLFSALLMGSGRIRTLSVVMIIGVATMLIWDLLLMPRFGPDVVPMGRLIGCLVIVGGMAWNVYEPSEFQRKATKLFSFFSGAMKLGVRSIDKLRIIQLFLWWKTIEKAGPLTSWLKPPSSFMVRFARKEFAVHVPLDLSFPQSFYEVFVRQDYLHPRLDQVDVIFDVGANCGLASLFLSCLYPCAIIHSFEPCLENFKVLQLNTRTFENIRTYRLGLFSFKGTKRITLSGRGGNNSFFTKGLVGEEIEVDTLDNVLSSQEIMNVDLLKIDIEGAEGDVLVPSQSLSKIFNIIGEIHPHLTDQQPLIDALSKNFEITFMTNENPMIFCTNKLPRLFQSACL